MSCFQNLLKIYTCMLADFKKERLADSWSSPLSAREQGMPGIIYTKRQTEVIKKKNCNFLKWYKFLKFSQSWYCYYLFVWYTIKPQNRRMRFALRFKTIHFVRAGALKGLWRTEWMTTSICGAYIFFNPHKILPVHSASCTRMLSQTNNRGRKIAQK